MSVEENVELGRRPNRARREQKRAESEETGDGLMTGNPEEKR